MDSVVIPVTEYKDLYSIVTLYSIYNNKTIELFRHIELPAEQLN